jgi:hypothetical protein
MTRKASLDGHLREAAGIWSENREQEETMSGKSGRHQEIVKRLLDTKAVDFAAVGKVVAELGPSLSLADEPWEGFCGTMRTFFHCYIINNLGGTVENVNQLAGATEAL